MSRLKKHVRNFTQVANDITNDKNLSLKAKGLFLFLLSKPDNWNFSARLIVTQNKDSIASVNTGLRELEDFGLLNRIPIQGGYDYEIFDTIQPHLVENRLSGKSTKRQSKIHLVENQSSISNKEFKAIEEEERENNTSPNTPEIICSCPSDYPLIEEYIHFVSARSKFPIFYASSVRDSLLNDNSKNHNRTFLAYTEFSNTRPDLKQNGVLPVGVNIFDLIGRGE
ncbi:MAG: hypothetical protein Q8N01_05995 [Sulfuricurvum sp.]|nr:hypothetical protein [Sulfuricurvum sp.]